MFLCEEILIFRIMHLINFLMSRKNVDESIVRNYYTSSMRVVWVSGLFLALSPLFGLPTLWREVHSFCSRWHEAIEDR